MTVRGHTNKPRPHFARGRGTGKNHVLEVGGHYWTAAAHWEKASARVRVANGRSFAERIRSLYVAAIVVTARRKAKSFLTAMSRTRASTKCQCVGDKFITHTHVYTRVRVRVRNCAREIYSVLFG